MRYSETAIESTSKQISKRSADPISDNTRGEQFTCTSPTQYYDTTTLWLKKTTTTTETERSEQVVFKKQNAR